MDRIRELAEGRGTPHGLGWRWFSMPAILRCDMNSGYYESERSDDYYSTEPVWPNRPNGYADRLNAWFIAWRIASDLVGEPADLIEWAAILA
mgnify:CR=1 FL=1